jgi:hypothetical protein
MNNFSSPDIAPQSPALPPFAQAHRTRDLLFTGTLSGLLLHGLVWDRSGGGLGLLLWTMFSCGAVCWLNREQTPAWQTELLGWCSLMILAPLMTVLYDAVAIRALMMLTMALCLGAVFFRTTAGQLRDARVPALLWAALRLPARVLTGSLPVVDGLFRTKWRHKSRLSGIFRGLLISSPLLFVFVGLLSSADAVFSQQLERLGRIAGSLTPETPLVSVILILLVIGVLSCSQPREAVAELPVRILPSRLGAEELTVIMGSLALLFVMFVLLQVSYLFGGRELIEMRSGLTMAAYARQGFFELLMVAGLTLGVLMAISGTQAPTSTPSAQRLFRSLGGVMIACVMIMLLSALFRLSLYVEQFGLSLSRLIALALMAWLGGALLWFAATVLLGRHQGFLAGLLHGAIACCLLLAFSNPVARVTDINLHHTQQTGSALDRDYLARLGADAIPALLHSLDQSAMSSTTRCEQANTWLLQITRHPADWRDWNLARHRALSLLRARLAECRH